VKNSTEINSISIEEYNYPLPDERIAKYPLPRRDSSKLLVYRDGEIQESVFSNIVDFLPADSLLVYNNTRVIQARLLFQKSTGAQIEVFCLEPVLPADYALSLSATNGCTWKCMVGNLKKWKEGKLSKLVIVDGLEVSFSVELLHSEGNMHQVAFSWDKVDVHFAQLLACAGELPIPPYLHRKTEESDLTNYQTVYSKIEGSVAAPTAGLHFTPEVFDSLHSKNITTEEVTLHVGAGTFQPVKSSSIDEHIMHTEVIAVGRATIEQLIDNHENIIAVGTTSVRTLESLYWLGASVCQQTPMGDLQPLQVSQWQPYTQESNLHAIQALQNILNYMEHHQLTTLHAETQIMIRPGYKFRIVKGIITNFHQPRSTLLLLVSAFVKGRWRELYDYALEHDFRFLSYGDSSLLMNN
jgi:S-adenosylmethionine:tRNA ribosyltransferase-isomerase